MQADCVGKIKKRQKNEVRRITKKDGEDRSIITTVLLCKKGKHFNLVGKQGVDQETLL